MNAPLPPASLVPPKQLKANNVGTAGQVATYVDEDTFERQDQSGGGSGTPFIEEFTTTAGQTVINLAHTPAAPAAVWLSSASGLYSKQGATRDYTIAGNVITLNSPALAGDIITVQGFESVPTLPANVYRKETFTGD